MRSLLSRLYSSLRRSLSWASHAKKILPKIGSFLLARKYLIALVTILGATAAGSIALHLKQAKDLGIAESDCDLRFAMFELEKRDEIEELQMRLEADHARELTRLREERDRKAEELAGARQALDSTITAFDAELNNLAQQTPEIVPWLDMPVPPVLLQD